MNTLPKYLAVITLLSIMIVWCVFSYSVTVTEKTAKIIGKYDKGSSFCYLIMENGDKVNTDWKEYTYFSSISSTITYTITVTSCCGISATWVKYDYGVD